MNILVTGGTGSVGSRVCEALTTPPFSHCVTVLSRSHSRQLAMKDAHKYSFETTDLYSRYELQRAVREWGIDAVVHCAADKHLLHCEEKPSHAIHHNLIGTMNLLETCRDVGIERFLFISTDKVCDPYFVYSMTKLLAEKAVCQVGHESERHYNAIRFGNLFGSSGSVLDIWKNSAEGIKLYRGRKDTFRFGINPNKVGSMIANCLFSDRQGVTFVSKDHKVINMTTLAEVVAEIKNCPLEVLPLRDGEITPATLITDQERAKTEDGGLLGLNEVDGYFVINRYGPDILSECAQRYQTENVCALNHEETVSFVENLGIF